MKPGTGEKRQMLVTGAQRAQKKHEETSVLVGTSIRICIGMYVCSYIRTYIHSDMHTCMQIHRYKHRYMHAYTCTNMSLNHVHSHITSNAPQDIGIQDPATSGRKAIIACSNATCSLCVCVCVCECV